MKKHLRFFALALSASLALSTTIMAVSPSFSDVPGTHWASAEITEAVNRGITNGYDDGTFRPTASVTNGHFSAFLARAFYKGEYDDSNANPWWKPYTDALDRHGVLEDTTLGTTIRTISVNQPINRYDMAQMMYNILVDQGAQIPAQAEQEKAQAAIGDWASVPTEYQNAVAACYAAGVLNGQTDGNFGGTNLMNRAQSCVVVDRLTNYIAENPGDGTANPDQGNDGDEDTTPPASTGTLANGEPATVENVLAMLDEIKEKYPQGTPWTVANSYYSPAFGTNSTGCAAYAYTVSDLIFGDLPVRKHTDYSSIKPGDVLEIKNSSGQTFHWSVVASEVDDEGWFQTTGGGSNPGDTVLWNSWGDINSESANWVVYTRYPE